MRRRLFAAISGMSAFLCLGALTIGMWSRISRPVGPWAGHGLELLASGGWINLSWYADGADGAELQNVWECRVVGLSVVYQREKNVRFIGSPAYDPSWRGWIASIYDCWIIAVAAVLPALYSISLLRRRSRRNLTASCRSCGYSLTGNTSGVCPECGTPVEGKAEAPT